MAVDDPIDGGKTNSSSKENGGGDTSSQTKDRKRKRRSRWGDATPSSSAAASSPAASAPLDAKAKVLAMQENIRARLAAAKAKTKQQLQQQQEGEGESRGRTAGVKRPAPTTTSASTGTALSSDNKAKRAKNFELDMSVTAPTFKQESTGVLPASKKPKVNPYLAHHQPQQQQTKEQSQDSHVASDADADADADAAVVDERLQRASKPRKRHKEISFVEPGHWQQVAEKKRELAAKVQASGYLSGRKAGHTIHSASIADIYSGTIGGEYDDHEDASKLPPRADAHPDTNMPLILEWWDVELLPSKLKKQVAAKEAELLTKQSKAALVSLNAKTLENEDQEDESTSKDDDNHELIAQLQSSCFDQAALTYSKTAGLVQHIVPIQPPNAKIETKPPVLHLTKKELKRQRKNRRQEKQRELQDMQAAGLIPAPEPRLTLKNFIQVLGDQAFLDPSQMEEKVTEQMAARQRVHLERNQAAKLTKEQRAAKRAKKLQEDTSHGVTVAIFYVKDMSHPYHRTKVDLNAQQNYITGGVVECQIPQLACVICEGGPKAIKRYRRLMEVRMKWTGPDDLDEDDEEDAVEEPAADGEAMARKFNPENKCQLVWQGMAVKRSFKGFVFQSCETSDQARKILKAKGVGHYWDQVLEHAKGRGDNLQLRLAGDESDEEENPYAIKEEDVIMKDSYSQT